MEYLGSNKPINNSVPIVSVCVTTYNHADFIGECLDSILNQETNFPFEIIVGEDESTDGTREICMHYAEKHPDKIRLFLRHQKDVIYIGGHATGRFNFIAGLNAARGSYIALCDGDDYWTDPLKLQKQVDFLEENKDFVLVYGPFINRYIESKTEKPDVLVKHRPLPLTMVFRNKIKDMPSSENCPNGDRFLLTYLSLIGEFHFLENITPSVRRIHKGGVMSMVAKEDKLDKQVATWSAIYDSFKGTKRGKELRKRKNLFTYKRIVWGLRSNPRKNISQALLFPFVTRDLALFKLLIKL